MPSCDHCGSLILFGGHRAGTWRFCDTRCAQKGAALLKTDQVPRSEIQQALARLHGGDCPRCGGPGPVDVYPAHRVWSALVLTKWSSQHVIGCRSCGRKAQLSASAFSMLLGWWGFPWGPFWTLIQLARNLSAVWNTPDPDWPSDALERVVRSARATGQTDLSKSRTVNGGFTAR